MSSAPQPQTGPYTPATPAIATAAGPQPGDIIGPYKLLQLLGEGGMGEVWMAEQSEPLRRRVAVKLIQEGRDSKLVLARFDAERQALALMDHPNIAKVLDAGQTPPTDVGGSPRPFFVMELVKGVPITEFCDQEHLTPRQRVELFIPVCQAVQHAHQKGIIHRDLKPSNILVGIADGKPVPKVIDFGVAKALFQPLTQRTLVTEVGSIVGTVEYMAPEQADLNNLDIDTRADVYALGVVLYELLTGSPPFTSEELRGAPYGEMLRMIREVEPPKPSTRLSTSTSLRTIAVRRKLDPKRLTKEIHGDLDWVVMKCLEKDRGRRYQTPNGLAADLGRYLAHEPVAAGPPGIAYRVKKWARRKPAVAGLFALAFLVPLIIAGLLFWHANRVEGMNNEIRERNIEVAREAAAARTAEQQERIQRGLAEERELDTRRHLYAANLGLFPRIWDSGRPIGLYGLLDSTRPERTGGQDLRGWEWYHLHQLIHPENVRFAGHSTPVQTAVFTADDSHVVSTGTDGIVIVWDSTSGQEIRRLAVSESQIFSLAVHPNGRHLAVACLDATAGVIDLETGRAVLRLDGHLLAVNHVAYSRDGSRIATASADNSIKVWDARTGQLTATLIGHEAGVGRVWFDDSGKRLASIGGDATVRFWNLETGMEDRPAALPIPSTVCTVHHDFDALAYLRDGNREVHLVELSKRKVTGSISGSGRPIRDLAFSDDGRFIATADADGDTQVFDIEAGRMTARYRGWGETVAFSHSGDRIAAVCMDNSVKIWPAADSHRNQFHGHEGATRQIAFNTRGTLMATGDAIGSIRLWDLQSHKQLHTLGIQIAEKGPPGSPPNPAREKIGRPLRTSFTMTPPPGGKYGPTNVREVFVYEGHAALILSLAFSPDSKLLASGGGDPEARLWDVETGKLLHELRHPQRVASVAFSPDGKKLATGCWDAAVRVWDVKTGNEDMILRAGEENIEAVVFHPAGKRVIAAGMDGVIRLWDLTSRSVVREFKGHTAAVHALALGPDGRTLASGSSDETVRIWDLQSGTHRYILQGHTGRITSLQFIPGEERLISGSDSEADGRVRIWDLRAGRELVSVPAPYFFVFGMAFDPVGRRLAVTSVRDIVFWEAADRAEVDRPTAAALPPKRTTDPIILPSEMDVRPLGFMHLKELKQLNDAVNLIKPERPDNQFLVAVVSVPYAHLNPTAKEYDRLKEKHRNDPDAKPAGPLRSYAIYNPRRFALVLPDGEDRLPVAVSAFGFTGMVGFNRGSTTESSTLSHEPRERAMMLVAWEVSRDDGTGPFRFRLDRGRPVEIPIVDLAKYRGNIHSGGTARQAGQRIGGANALREQRQYSDFEH